VLPCPSCGRPLVRSAPGPAEHWACGNCGGRAFTIGRMRTAFPAEFFNKVQAATGAGGWRGIRRCPLCTMHLVRCRVEHGGSTWALDHCDRCRFVWFDRGEHEAGEGRIPAPPPPDPVLDGRSSRSVYASGANAPESFEATPGFPGSGLSDIPMVLGLPVPSGVDTWNRPWATWALAGTIVAASLLAFAYGGEGINHEWGLIPSLPLRHMAGTYVTSFFLHGGLWHLISNVFFLLSFGTGVENAVGPRRFLLLTALSALGGKVLFTILQHGSPVPSVGASGGISGILVYWALAFPHARVRMFWMWHVSMMPTTFTFSARTALGAWVVLQVIGSFEQWAGFHGINHLAHLGGAAVGAAFWYFGPDGPRPVAVKSDTIRLKSPLRWED
jgi:membrane associated rhomboid family serine protease